MTTRSRSNIVVFNHPFLLPAVDRVLPAGGYRVVTDEELIDGLSFSAYRRVSTMIFVPAQGHEATSIEMVTIDPLELKAAQERDASTPQSLPTHPSSAPGGNPLTDRSEPFRRGNVRGIKP
jgi:hypothetical protein